MIYRVNELDKFTLSLSKEEARNLLQKASVEDYPFLDRFNLEVLLKKIFKGNVKVFPNFEDRSQGLKIGYGFNYCFPSSIMERNVTENILEIPLLHEFLARGCKICYLGKSVSKFVKFHKNMENFSEEWKKLPTPYKPIASWIEDCCENYESKYELEFPEVDFVIMNAFPSFFYSNMMFYLINLHYSKKKVPVFLWDMELRTLRTKDQETFQNLFRYSGADKVFSPEQFNRIADNAYWLLQIPGSVLDRIKTLNSQIKVIPFFPPYDLSMGLFSPNDKPYYKLSYIGNDSERKQTFKKFFSPLSKKNRLNLFGGGMSQRSAGYEDLKSYKGNTKFHGPISQDQVWNFYNLSRTCLSIARQRYYNTGFIVHRWLEVVLGGSILLLPRELYGVERYFNKSFLVEDVDELEKRIDFFNNLKISKIIEANNWQKKFIYRTFSSERNVNAIFRAIGR